MFSVQQDHCFSLKCVVIWHHLRVADVLQGMEVLNPFKLFLDSVFISLIFIILC